jgi:hypothetical protein
MQQNLTREFQAFHYLRRNRNAVAAGSSSASQEMTMNSLSRSSTFPLAAGIVSWMLNLATRLLARFLNMPEPMVHHTGVFVFAHVQAVESSVGKTLCPIRLLRQLRNYVRQTLH